MPSIAEATAARRDLGRRRFATGLLCLLGGAVLVGVGAAGAIPTATQKMSVIIGGFTVIGALVVLVIGGSFGGRERRVAAVGICASVVSLLIVWTMAPADVLTAPGPASIGGVISYLAAIVVVLAAFLAGANRFDLARTRPTGEDTASWSRAPSHHSGGNQLADGGTADDDLQFFDDE